MTNDPLLYISDSFYVNTERIRRNPIFLHIGTFTGKLETKLTSVFPTCKIFSFEPHPANFENLIKNTNRLQNVTRINKAIVVDESQQIVNLNGWGSAATTYKVSSGLPVQATTLKKFIDDYDVKEIDTIFYNAEGTEMEFLPYIINNEFDKNVVQICLNFHVHVPQFQITYKNVEDLMNEIKINEKYDINDDRLTKIASKATCGDISDKYPCFLFVRKN